MRRVLLLVVIAACGTTDEDAAPTYGDGLGTPENPIPQTGVPYAVHTQTSAPSAATQSDVTRIAGGLRAFAQTPGHSLLTLAKVASPEELAVLDAMSSSLRSRLEGWIDTEIDKVPVDGMRGRAIAGDMADFVDASLAHYSIESTLTFSPTKTTHTVGALSFRLAGLDVVVPVGGLAGDDTQQRVQITVGTGGTVTFGDQEFGVDFGQHAWHGINLGLTALTGVGVDKALSNAVNCTALAKAVSLKSYNGVTVGHQNELTALCEHSVGALVHQLDLDFAGVDVMSIHLPSGTAHLVDENGDGLANRTDAGAWTVDPTAAGVSSAMFTALAPGR
ncbi:MAG TPA: hypothetical protein VL326_17905 [Kofleriaceae bacterium]|jgi:hypothetical protein|nr:hypothetical protein [Kofleriaceae bacterium]